MCFFSDITIYETKTCLLLIETFKTRNDGHLEQLRVAIYYLSGAVRILRFGEYENFKTIQ